FRFAVFRSLSALAGKQNPYVPQDYWIQSIARLAIAGIRSDRKRPSKRGQPSQTKPKPSIATVQRDVGHLLSGLRIFRSRLRKMPAAPYWINDATISLDNELELLLLRGIEEARDGSTKPDGNGARDFALLALRHFDLACLALKRDDPVQAAHLFSLASTGANHARAVRAFTSGNVLSVPTLAMHLQVLARGWVRSRDAAHRGKLRFRTRYGPAHEKAISLARQAIAKDDAMSLESLAYDIAQGMLEDGSWPLFGESRARDPERTILGWIRNARKARSL